MTGSSVCTRCIRACMPVCPAIFPMQICLPLAVFSFCRVIPPCISFILPTLHPFILLPFAPIFLSRLMSHSSVLPPLFFFIHSFISALKGPQGEPYQKELHKAPQLFPRSVFLCMCEPVNKAYLSLTDLLARESNLSELTGRSNNIHFRNI